MPPSSRRGITLLEVLATMLLLGIVLPVTMRALTVSMQAASQARHVAEASRLAESKLNELVLLGEAHFLTGRGGFAEDWADYRWEARSRSADFGLHEVTVAVYWTQRGRERSVALTTLAHLRGLEPDEALDETVD